jgi:hypothetical protein
VPLKAQGRELRGACLQVRLEHIFNGCISRLNIVYDYAGVFTRYADRIVWKAVVRHSHVVCRPAGTLDQNQLSDGELNEVIRQLVAESIAEALASSYRGVRQL